MSRNAALRDISKDVCQRDGGREGDANRLSKQYDQRRLQRKLTIKGPRGTPFQMVALKAVQGATADQHCLI